MLAFQKLHELRKELTDDVSNKKTFNLVTYIVLGLVSLFMTAINIATDKGFLTICTAIFAGLCIIDILLSFINETFSIIAKWLFAFEVVMMFTYFLISGNPDGFSAIWICMLPSLGMFFFDRIRGSGLCAVMFFILIFLLWTDFGNSLLQYEYTATFKMRFPILFVAFHLLAFLLETLREHAYTEMRKMQAYYKDLSIRDQLTGLFNRQGMFSVVETDEKFKNPALIGAAMFDIDHFKDVNDTYGHNAGDMVLKDFANILKDNLDAVVCRWGGEEFVSIVTDKNVKTKDLDRIKKLIEEHTFTDGEHKFNLTVSIGVCIIENFKIKDIDFLIENADQALYTAKNTGRNKIVYHE